MEKSIPPPFRQSPKPEDFSSPVFGKRKNSLLFGGLKKHRPEIVIRKPLMH
jgi:hypothetical protein